MASPRVCFDCVLNQGRSGRVHSLGALRELYLKLYGVQNSSATVWARWVLGSQSACSVCLSGVEGKPKVHARPTARDSGLQKLRPTPSSITCDVLMIAEPGETASEDSNSQCAWKQQLNSGDQAAKRSSVQKPPQSRDASNSSACKSGPPEHDVMQELSKERRRRAFIGMLK